MIDSRLAELVHSPRAAGDEADEVRRARARDASVWAAWHDRHYPFVYRYAYSRLRNRQDAEDVASQVFLEAIRGIDRYRYRGRPVLAWFYGIARNLVSHRYRDYRRSTPFSGLGTQLDDVADSRGVEQDLDRLVVQDALDRLKPDHREVLALRFLMDLPTRQVSLVIEKTEAATYSLQVRALSALQRAMTEKNLRKGPAAPNDRPPLSA